MKGRRDGHDVSGIVPVRHFDEYWTGVAGTRVKLPFMIERHYGQRQIVEGFFTEPVEDWWEPWMKEADEILDDEEVINTVYEALRRRHPQSGTRGRMGTPAEIVIRLMVLKHVRGWSYETLEREVRANMVYRMFTRIGAEKVPDAKTMGRLGQALGPEVVEAVHKRLVGIACEKKVVRGRKLRVDTTVVETNIHYPTDSSLLGDGVRVLTRTMQRLSTAVKGAGEKIRNRMRSASRRVMEIARAGRSRGKGGEQKRQRAYQRLLTITGQVVRQAERSSASVTKMSRRSRRVRQLQQELDRTSGLVRHVMKQTKARVLGNDPHFTEKIVSIFEPQTEVIRKGKASKPTEFGKMVKIQEAENQIITSYEVYEKKPNDSDLLVKAVEEHCERLGQIPDLVAADAAFHSPSQKAAVQAMGVKHISVPNRPTKNPVIRRIQKTRWFRKGQKWRTGCEGRISVLKRRHGLDRCRYRGQDGMNRWVGFGVIADNLINIGRVLATQA
jgi:IS5 family transposase